MRLELRTSRGSHRAEAPDGLRRGAGCGRLDRNGVADLPPAGAGAPHDASGGPRCGADRIVPGSHAEWLARRCQSAQLWQRPDDGHISALSSDIADEILDLAGGVSRGFGSLRVNVTIGDTDWRTSIFPSTSGTYVLPLKKAVRTAEGITTGDTVHVRIELVDV